MIRAAERDALYVQLLQTVALSQLKMVFDQGCNFVLKSGRDISAQIRDMTIEVCHET